MWHMGDKRDANRVWGKTPEEKRPLARSKVSTGG
jgi:hypothetical protein